MDKFEEASKIIIDEVDRLAGFVVRVSKNENSDAVKNKLDAMQSMIDNLFITLPSLVNNMQMCKILEAEICEQMVTRAVNTEDVENNLNVSTNVSTENIESSPVISEVASSEVKVSERAPVGQSVVGSTPIGDVVQTNSNQNNVDNFVLSPMEEGVTSAVSEVVEDVVNNFETVPIVSSDTGEVAPEVATTIPIDPIADSAITTSDVIVTSTLDRYRKNNNNSPKAILVNPEQNRRLAGSRENQKASLTPNNSAVVSTQDQINELTNRASQAYAAGNQAEAEQIMAQVSALAGQNTLTADATSSSPEVEGGITFVKK